MAGITPIRNMKNKKRNLDFDRGYAVALATLLLQYDQPGMAEDVYRENFMTVKQLREAGVEEGDINVLKPIIAEIKRKDKLWEKKESKTDSEYHKTLSRGNGNKITEHTKRKRSMMYYFRKINLRGYNY